MPNFDGTGPERRGPQTGRGLGPCNPDAQPQEAGAQTPERGFGRGLGRRLGRAFRRGRGRRGRW
jgi:hypothetical protein